HDFDIDRCYVHGDAALGQKRGIALNTGTTTIRNSYISDIKAVAQDTQAIAGWNGPGPYTIENNYLEGAGENFILGGSDPPISGLIAQDVIFRRNHLAKPAAWRSEKWQVKNLFELKNAKRVLVEANLMEFVWQEAQVGYAILLTPRNQDGKAPWVRVEDVTIRYNLVRHAGGGLQIIGEDSNYPSESTRRVRIAGGLLSGGGLSIQRHRWRRRGALPERQHLYQRAGFRSVIRQRGWRRLSARPIEPVSWRRVRRTRYRRGHRDDCPVAWDAKPS